jgi:hypothetical protein
MDSLAASPWSSILFARPSFWTSFGQFLDFGNTAFEFNRAVDGDQADFLAIKADWHAVGDDLRRAVKEFERERDVAASR